jgi:hypothetical protein
MLDVAMFLRQYCDRRALHLVDEDDRYLVRLRKDPNFLVEIEVPKRAPDWSVTIRDETTGSEHYDEWYDVYAHASESDGDVMRQQQISLERFLDMLLAAELRLGEGPRWTVLGLSFGKTSDVLQCRTGGEWHELGSGFF